MNNTFTFLKALGDIDEKHLEEYYEIAEKEAMIKRNKKAERMVNMKYILAPVCAVDIAAICFVGVDKVNIPNKPNENIGVEKNNGIENLATTKESLEIDLNVFQVARIMSSDMDVKREDYNGTKIPEWVWNEIVATFEEKIGISLEDFKKEIPEKFEYVGFHSLSIRGYKDANLPNEYRLHDYVFEYRTDSYGEIRIAICKGESPLRDYYFMFEGKKSKIGNTELEISKYEDQYLVNFEFNNINYDIETSNITEDELLELLTSIITENFNKSELIEDKDTNVNEPPKENVSNYPEFYAGNYIDENGNNVVLLCENNEENRKQICSLLRNNRK